MTPLNWTTEVFVSLVALGPYAAAFALTLRQHLQERSRASLLFFLMVSFSFLAAILTPLSHLYLSVPLIAVQDVCTLAQITTLVLWIDTITRDSPDPRKLVVMVVLVTFSLTMVLNTPDLYFVARYPNGELHMAHQPLIWYLASVTISSGFAASIILAYSAIIVTRAPTSLKKPALLLFAGAIIWGPGNLVLILFQATKVVPGITHAIGGIGVLVLVIAITKYPRLGHLLPFKALRVTVMDTSAGIPLFTHIWASGDHRVEDELFSGMVQGVSLIVKESVAAGDFEELKTARAVLIMRWVEKYPIACVLVATRSSRALRQSLDRFAGRFIEEFAGALAQPTNVGQFKPASKLVAECFPLIPEYD